MKVITVYITTNKQTQALIGQKKCEKYSLYYKYNIRQICLLDDIVAAISGNNAFFI